MRAGKSFRKTEKEGYFVHLPKKVVEAIRERAELEGRPQALVTTEALCRQFDLDPREFGITPLATVAT